MHDRYMAGIYILRVYLFGTTSELLVWNCRQDHISCQRFRLFLFTYCFSFRCTSIANALFIGRPEVMWILMLYIIYRSHTCSLLHLTNWRSQWSTTTTDPGILIQWRYGAGRSCMLIWLLKPCSRSCYTR